MSSLCPLCGNSPKGWFHQEPDFRIFGKVDPVAYDDDPTAATTEIMRLNNDIERHLHNSRRVWEQHSPSRISPRAFNDAIEAAKVKG